MVGIDYSKAVIEYREKFSLTMAAAANMANRLLEEKQADGCIVVSTCNRTELWFSNLKEKEPRSILLEEKKIVSEEYDFLFEQRFGEEAVVYLMELACGIHSQIFGEDQILTQIKQALEIAREGKYTDNVLEMLFRSAITAAKKVKTQVKLTREKTSVPAKVIQLLKEKVDTLKEKTCLVIGNGEMGRMMAKSFAEQECNVFMTLRQYKRNDVIIPAGCNVIPYEDRELFLSNVDIIVSATTSPHFTLKKEKLKGISKEKNFTFVDLAVPRDIDPEILTLSNNIQLYDMDKLGMEEIYDKKALQEALNILREYKEDFISWYYFREWVPAVQIISAMTGELTSNKLNKIYKSLELSKEEKGALKENIEEAAEKAVAKLVYGLREHLEREKWEDCILALEAVAKDF